MKKIAMVLTAAALVALGGTAQAQLTEYYTAQQGGSPDPGAPTLKVVSTVTGSYDYSYTFTVGTGTGGSFVPETTIDPLFTFTVGGFNSAIATAITGGTSYYTTGSTIVWNFAGVYTGTVSFDAPLPPGTVFGAGQDGTVNWSGVTQGPAVPEPTTVLAGALMLLPLGVGAFRAIRKDRVA